MPAKWEKFAKQILNLANFDIESPSPHPQPTARTRTVGATGHFLAQLSAI